MKLKEFMQMIGGRHATIMVCQVNGSQFNGGVYQSGDMVNVTAATALALYKQMANTPDGGEERRWIPKDANMTFAEAVMLNQHFDKEHKKETGEQPVKIKSPKTK